MSSERIPHDGSARCPVEGDAVVEVKEVGSTRIYTGDAKDMNWAAVEFYRVIRGWSRPLADIFAELPDEAEWITADKDGRQDWWKLAPSQRDSTNDWDEGTGDISCRLVCATYSGDWRESKRKRPEPELPEIERVGQARAKAQMKAKPAPWFAVVGFPDGGAMFTHCETREAADEIAIAEAKDGNEAFVCRAVASFTAKVERTNYENGGG